MQQLVNGYIYRLPEGSRLLAFGKAMNWLFYDARSSPSNSDLPDYELDISGMILFAGRPIGWTSDDLIPMGHTLFIASLKKFALVPTER
jgi:hypothetical protein